MLEKNYAQNGAICRVTFALPQIAARGGKDVRLLGDFNGWNWENAYRLQPDGAALVVDVDLPTGRDYQFRFLIDSQLWENHWNADAYVATPFGVDNSVLWLPALAKRLSEVAPPAPNPSAATFASPGRGPVDDLTAIDGIGPRIAQVLQAAGIMTFADLAGTKPGLLREILAAGGSQFRRHDPSSWPRLASRAARKTSRRMTSNPETRRDRPGRRRVRHLDSGA